MCDTNIDLWSIDNQYHIIFREHYDMIIRRCRKTHISQVLSRLFYAIYEPATELIRLNNTDFDYSTKKMSYKLNITLPYEFNMLTYRLIQKPNILMLPNLNDSHSIYLYDMETYTISNSKQSGNVIILPNKYLVLNFPTNIFPKFDNRLTIEKISDIQNLRITYAINNEKIIFSHFGQILFDYIEITDDWNQVELKFPSNVMMTKNVDDDDHPCPPNYIHGSIYYNANRNCWCRWDGNIIIESELPHKKLQFELTSYLNYDNVIWKNIPIPKLKSKYAIYYGVLSYNSLIIN